MGTFTVDRNPHYVRDEKKKKDKKVKVKTRQTRNNNEPTTMAWLQEPISRDIITDANNKQNGKRE